MDRVQCGECLKFRVTSFKQPIFENGKCVKWFCRICGQEGYAIGRERQITPEIWERMNGNSGFIEGMGTGKGVKRRSE